MALKSRIVIHIQEIYKMKIKSLLSNFYKGVVGGLKVFVAFSSACLIVACGVKKRTGREPVEPQLPMESEEKEMEKSRPPKEREEIRPVLMYGTPYDTYRLREKKQQNRPNKDLQKESKKEGR